MREIKSNRLSALAALYFISILNLAFWRFAATRVDLGAAGSFWFALSLPVCFFLLTYAFLSLLLWPYFGKAALAVLLVLSAAANYFMFNLNILIDSEMLRNVFDTNFREAGEMATTSGVLWILLSGVLPAILLFRLRITYRPPLREVGVRALHIVLALAAACGLGLFFYQDYSTYTRNNKTVLKVISPANYLASTVKLLRKRALSDQPFVVIDENPNHVPYEDPYYTVLVLMIGETARAMNFSLNGYQRDTNPELAKQDIVNFSNVTSSGTATAFSLPCMFSHLPRSQFNIDVAASSENLLDIMQKAGYDVLWLDNDGGSKGVSDRVPTVDLMRGGAPEYRNGDTCFDEVLLDGLEERLKNIKKDTVIVLHMMGSHGPSYYRRYPEAFRAFTPTADTAEIQGRPREEIVNTYDNTILYTDHVVSEAIDILKKFPQHEAGLLYVSDHGESLGENGLYLHGFPYALAPREQTHIPMILWMSETMRREDHVDYEKLRAATGSLALSHDNLFHSVLGLVEIDSELYNPELDLFRDFRTKKLPYQ